MFLSVLGFDPANERIQHLAIILVEVFDWLGVVDLGARVAIEEKGGALGIALQRIFGEPEQYGL
jgi:hypothetical protein